MKMRLSIALVLLTLAAPVLATDPPAKPTLDLSVKDDALDFDLKPEARQFLDKSVVRVPKSPAPRR